MAGFICGKVIKDGSIPLDRLKDYNNLLLESEFNTFLEQWIIDNADILCQWIKDNCDGGVVTPPDTTNPVADFTAPSFPSGGGSRTINLTATDNDTKLTYNWSTDCPSLSVSFSNTSVKNPIVTTVNDSITNDINCNITVKVCDSSNNCVTVTKPINIPRKVTTGDTTDPTLSVNWGTISSSAVATPVATASDDSGTVNYSWTTNCADNISDEATNRPTITFTRTNVSQNCTAIVEVCDSSGNCVQESHVYVVPALVSTPTPDLINVQTSCSDYGNTGAYTEASVVITTNQPISTPNGWTAIGNTSTKFTRSYIANGTKTVTLSNSNGSTSQNFSVNCIGAASGNGLVVPDPVVDGQNITVNPTGGTGNYTYTWSVSSTECYQLTGTGNSRTVECITNPTLDCTQATVTVIVSDGQTTITKDGMVTLYCHPDTPNNIDLSAGTLEFFAKRGETSNAIICPYTVLAEDESYKYTYFVPHANHVDPGIQSLTLTIKRNGNIVNTYSGSGATSVAGVEGTKMIYNIPKTDLNVTGTYTFEVKGVDTDGGVLDGAKVHTCSITENTPTIAYFSNKSFVGDTITAILNHERNETVVLKRELYNPTEGDSAIITVGDETVTLTNASNVSDLSFVTGDNLTTSVSIKLSDDDGNSSNFAMGILKILSATKSTVTSVQADAQVSIELKSENDPTDGLVIENISPESQTITLPTNSVRLNTQINSNDGYTSLWSKLSGGNANIVTPNTEDTDITGLVEGTYVFRVTATGVHGSTAFRDFTIVVNPAPVTSSVSFTNIQGNNTESSTATLTGSPNEVVRIAISATGLLPNDRFDYNVGTSSNIVGHDDNLPVEIDITLDSNGEASAGMNIFGRPDGSEHTIRSVMTIISTTTGTPTAFFAEKVAGDTGVGV